MNYKRMAAYLLSVIVAFSVCMPAFGAEAAQTMNAEAAHNEEQAAEEESAPPESTDGTKESASPESTGGIEEPEGEDLLGEPNTTEEQTIEEQAAEEESAVQEETEQMEAAEQMEEERDAMSERAAGKSIAQAIWTQDNETLTFYYGPPVSSGKGFKGETATAVWSGKDVTDNVDEIPGWVDSLGYSEDYIVHIVFDDSFLSVKPTNTHAWFRQLWGLKDIDLGGLDTSEVTDMSRMFSECDNLVSLDVSGLDTSKVTSMQEMFENCSSLKSLNLGEIDTHNVTDMESMFSGCRSLTSLDVSGFDTSNVTFMDYMFGHCTNLQSLDVSGFDTSKVKDMGAMFTGCKNLTSLDVSRFDTSNVFSMGDMFQGCRSLTHLDVSRFDTSNVTSMAYMFENCSNLSSLDVSGFDTSKVEEMRSMFAGCSNLGSLDVSKFKTSKVSEMDYMFEGCSSLTSLDVSKFDTSNAINMENMFAKCSSLTSLDVSGFDTSQVLYMDEMFSFLTLTSLDLSGFDTSELVTASGMFRGCKNLKTIYCQDNRDVWKASYRALGDKMFDSCYALVGSDGRSEIAYNKNKTDASMAKAVGMGGYFTPKIDTLVLKKTARGDMFNLANTVKITWKAVPDAKYYKVYRKDITSGVQGKYELVFVTSKLVGFDKDPNLVDGHAYKYKIMASLTGKGDPSGNSPYAYFKTMYRLKTVVIRSAKNTEPGKVTVRYDKTKSGDSYVLRYSENEDMTDAKTKVVKGADNNSCTISGLKKGKTYYFSIRVRKNVDGVNYYTTFGKPRKVKVEK